MGKSLTLAKRDVSPSSAICVHAFLVNEGDRMKAICCMCSVWWLQWRPLVYFRSFCPMGYTHTSPGKTWPVSHLVRALSSAPSSCSKLTMWQTLKFQNTYSWLMRSNKD